MIGKRFVYYEHKGADYILDTPNTELNFIEMLGDTLEPEEIVDKLNELYEKNQQLERENKELKQQIEELEFKLRTIEAYDRTVKEEHSDTVYYHRKKLEKW